MSIADFMKRMFEFGAPPEAVTFAVAAIEEERARTRDLHDADASRRAADRDRKRNARIPKEIFHGNSAEIPSDVQTISGNVQDFPGNVREIPVKPPFPKENAPAPPKEITHSPALASLGLDRPRDADFEVFWQVYPRRTGKKAALAKFQVAVRSGVTIARILDGARRYAEACRMVELQFVKHPEVWLNKGCYDDEHQPQAARASPAVPTKRNPFFAATERATRPSHDFDFDGSVVDHIADPAAGPNGGSPRPVTPIDDAERSGGFFDRTPAGSDTG